MKIFIEKRTPWVRPLMNKFGSSALFGVFYWMNEKIYQKTYTLVSQNQRSVRRDLLLDISGSHSI